MSGPWSGRAGEIVRERLVLSRSLTWSAEQAAIAASERELQSIDVAAEAAAIAEQGRPDAAGE